MPLAPGQRLRNIRVDRLLGAGGMSEVWRGFDERLERPVALKLVHPRRRLDPDARARVLREAQILSSLEHPGICKVFDLVEEGSDEVLVLELVEGESLRVAMDRGLPERRRLAVAEGIAEVLAVAHRHHIVHRDLKPRNVICTPSGGVKVLDFDLAHRVGESSGRVPPAAPGGEEPHEGLVCEVVGTAAYMSPEQARGEPLTTASDLYSLGVLLHELFSGAPAYPECPTLESQLLKVSQAETLRVEGVEPALAGLIESLEVLEPERRPSAEEVARRLRALQVGLAGRRRRQALVAVAAALALGAAGWLAVELVPELTGGALPGVRRVGILPVVNSSGEPSYDWVSFGLTPILVAVMGSDRALDVTVEERGRAETAGVDLIVSGVLERTGHDLRLTAELSGPGGRLGRCQGVGSSPLEAAEALLTALVARLRPGATPPHLATALSPDLNADLLFGLGLDARGRRRREEARHCFELGLERDPGFLWARLELARCGLDEGRMEAARAEATSVAATARTRGRADVVAAAAAVIRAVGGADRR